MVIGLGCGLAGHSKTGGMAWFDVVGGFPTQIDQFRPSVCDKDSGGPMGATRNTAQLTSNASQKANDE
jgi:hypothetical protein